MLIALNIIVLLFLFIRVGQLCNRSNDHHKRLIEICKNGELIAKAEAKHSKEIKLLFSAKKGLFESLPEYRARLEKVEKLICQ